MSSSPLAPDTLLSITLGAIMSSHKYATDPALAIVALRETAGDRVDLLAVEVGCWIGYYDDDHTRVLTEALREAFSDLDLHAHIEDGQRRRYTPTHRTP